MISILLSCYRSNFEYLKQQIDSIINQTEKDWELLVYDDGAGNIFGFLATFYPKEIWKKIFLFDEGHKGYAGAYNFLLSKAKGEYVCFCDHDDIWMPEKLAVEKKYLDENPNVDCVFSWLRWFGEKDKLEMFEISDEEISKELFFYQPIKQPSAMFRRNRFSNFDSPFDQAGDFWFWAKHKDRHYHLIKEFLVKYRRHPGEATKDKTAFRENSARVIQESFKNKFNICPSLEICKMLDPYSKTYNPELKDFVSKIITHVPYNNSISIGTI